MSEYKEKRKRPSGRYYSRRRSPYFPRISRGGGGYSGPKSYVRQHDFKYSGAEQQPREPKAEISSYVKSPTEYYSQKSQTQPDIEALLEELKLSRDPALLDEVTQRLNDETEQMENAAKIPELQAETEQTQSQVASENLVDENIDN